MKRILILIATATTTLSFVPLASAQDPFGNPAKSKKPAKPAQARAFDPFADNGPTAQVTTEEPAPELRNDLSLRYEVFSLDLATAASLMRADHADADLYKTLVAMVDQEKAIQENLTVIRTKLGERSSGNSSLEYIYPTEWNPAEIPQSIGVKIDPPTNAQGNSTGGKPNLAALDEAPKLEELPLFVTPASPSAFEMRMLGFTFEVEANSRADGVIEANIAPDHVTLANLSEWGQGVSTLEMPEIESQRISTQILLVPGLPRLVGTINRPPVSKVDPDPAERIWFAFVTASRVK